MVRMLVGTLACGILAASGVAVAQSGQKKDTRRQLQTGGLQVIYFLRHAETQVVTVENEDGYLEKVCGEDECAMELSSLGKLRSQKLVVFFEGRDLLNDITHVFASHKQRTLNTVKELANAANLHGVQQLPADRSELDPETVDESIDPTVQAILDLPPDSVAIVAGHAQTIYPIMQGLGLDTTSNGDQFPCNDDGEVEGFGHLWKVMIMNQDVSRLAFRLDLQPGPLEVTGHATME